MVSEPYVLWFKDCTLETLPKVGGKNASLGEMIKGGLPVPPGFAVTTHAYEKFLIENDIKEDIRQIVTPADTKDKAALEEVSTRLRNLIDSTPIPDPIQEVIGASYEILSRDLGLDNVAVAVRSSATAEDLPGASFAGQQETFLGVIGVDELLEKTKRCWSSLFTPRAIAYRKKMSFPHEKVQISVGVQKMVKAETAGVMFTINPMTGDRSKVTINANWGFGESVVSGIVTPDTYEIDKVTHEIIKQTISNKSICCAINPESGQVEVVKVASEKQDIPYHQTDNFQV